MTKLFGLLGHPVGHSMSPTMHKVAYEQLGLDASYTAYDVTPEKLEEAVRYIRTANISGCNVTIPHKVEVMKYLDEIDEEAVQIGAVNTIINQNGKLKGYNTDGRGYIQSLLSTIDTLTGHRVLVIGAGGAARAVVAVLLSHQPESVVIANRTEKKAEALVQLFTKSDIHLGSSSVAGAAARLEEFSIIINTTSVGMSPHIEDMPISLERMSPKAVVSDLIYNPLETRLLKEAKKRGANTENGIGMFVHQGVLSIQHWTGLTPKEAPMRKSVIEQLKHE
ncbi:shikimate dehydrogenase [Alkalicoccobacillus porphyridii]|uniref:Shikimate dehydrogenase (NADP(+)) n=1 Tax=Alkalicoccobacillus porphyridii TaxID=2597270 RepID=A0A553ZZC3_9BACI|nr:shikimate dehydrogenase [Alkalicoccobacillus porphyridii]TSB46794.1 shikimate dehydrogenase [Alkalicoccobacillus porphyridii]